MLMKKAIKKTVPLKFEILPHEREEFYEAAESFKISKVGYFRWLTKLIKNPKFKLFLEAINHQFPTPTETHSSKEKSLIEPLPEKKKQCADCHKIYDRSVLKQIRGIWYCPVCFETRNYAESTKEDVGIFVPRS